MALSGLDPAVTPRTQIPFAGGIRLYGGGDFYTELVAHGTCAPATRKVPAILAGSPNVVLCGKNGLNPIGAS